MLCNLGYESFYSTCITIESLLSSIHYIEPRKIHKENDMSSVKMTILPDDQDLSLNKTQKYTKLHKNTFITWTHRHAHIHSYMHEHTCTHSHACAHVKARLRLSGWSDLPFVRRTLDLWPVMICSVLCSSLEAADDVTLLPDEPHFNSQITLFLYIFPEIPSVLASQLLLRLRPLLNWLLCIH